MSFKNLPRYSLFNLKSWFWNTKFFCHIILVKRMVHLFSIFNFKWDPLPTYLETNPNCLCMSFWLSKLFNDMKRHLIQTSLCPNNVWNMIKFPSTICLIILVGILVKPLNCQVCSIYVKMTMKQSLVELNGCHGNTSWRTWGSGVMVKI
jgi:hypothetical protein